MSQALPLEFNANAQALALASRACGLSVAWFDVACIVICKPPGLLAVPGRGSETDPSKADCAITRVQTAFADALVVHRLDQATSGLMVFARGAAAQRHLSAQFEARSVNKTYVAVVQGPLPTSTGQIDLPVGADWPNRPMQKIDTERGKASLTHWQVLVFDAASNTSSLQLTPHTGRTHQLRVHLAAIGHPIVGDTLYKGPPAPRLMLHASTLAFAHPANGNSLAFESPAPWP